MAQARGVLGSTLGGCRPFSLSSICASQHLTSFITVPGVHCSMQVFTVPFGLCFKIPCFATDKVSLLVRSFFSGEDFVHLTLTLTVHRCHNSCDKDQYDVCCLKHMYITVALWEGWGILGHMQVGI